MDKDIKLEGIPSLSQEDVIKTLGSMYLNATTNSIPYKSLPSVMLWGAPGIGKSQSVREIGSFLESNTYKKVIITDVRLILFNPVDLRGIPTASADKELAIWLKPKIFDMDPSNDVINILFLDEISAAPQSVQAAAYQITLDRVIGEHKLPDNCIVIAAGNRVTDKSVAYTMPRALANRLLHIEMSSSFDSWNNWAIKHNINSKILALLRFRSDYLVQANLPANSLAFATPRSWEMVSNVINTFNGDIDKAKSLISGLVGVGVSMEFFAFLKVYNTLPNIEDIFNGKDVDIPTSTDSLYALISALATRAKDYINDIPKLTNSIRYALKLPSEYSFILFKDYLYLTPNIKSKLLRIPEFMKWIEKRGKLLDEI